MENLSLIGKKFQKFRRTLPTWNQRRPSTPPTPTLFSSTRVIGTPAYNSSSPRSSQMEVMKDAGFRISPNS